MLNVRCVLLVAAGVSACDHSEPFRPGDYGPDGPRTAGPLVQLTYNPGDDRSPRWLLDGAILYSAERRDRPDRDRCFAVQPPGGGGITGYACRTMASNDSLDVFEDAAPGPADQLAYVRAGSHRFPVPLGPDVQAIVIAPSSDPNDARVVRVLPYPTPWSSIHEAVSHLGWVSASRLVYVGEQVRYPRPPGCPACPADTMRTGLELVVLDFSAADTGVLTAVPGTDSATSVAVGPGSDTVFYTLANATVVLRQALSTGQTDTVYDFGPGRVARDVAFGAGRLAVTVGGRPGDGGELHVLTVASGTVAVVDPGVTGELLWFARPALSPDGQRVLAEARRLTVTPIFDGMGGIIGFDTAAAALPDIWLGTLP